MCRPEIGLILLHNLSNSEMMNNVGLSPYQKMGFNFLVFLKCGQFVNHLFSVKLTNSLSKLSSLTMYLPILGWFFTQFCGICFSSTNSDIFLK